jgi:hypothetical protein
MDQEAVAVGQDVQVVDPDVRGYVYSLVTAVSVFLTVPRMLVADIHWVAGRIQWRRCRQICPGRRRIGMSAGHKAVAEAVRRKEQPHGRGAMSG